MTARGRQMPRPSSEASHAQVLQNLVSNKNHAQQSPLTYDGALSTPRSEAMNTPNAPTAPEFCTLDIQGMTCASCVNHVEKAITKVHGVEAAMVNLATEQAKVRFIKGANTSMTELFEAIDRAGYSATITPPLGQRLVNQDVEFWAPTGLSRVVLAMLLSTPLMAPMLLMPLGIHLEIDPLIQLSLATPVQFWLGSRFFRGAYKALRSGTANMDLLIALGTTSAFGLSLYLMSIGMHHELYFESASVVISMVLLGKWLELNAKHKTSGAIRELQKLWPESAHVLDQDLQSHEIQLEHLLVGDKIKVFPSERIPVDGVVMEGESWVDESLITGESAVVHKTKGQRVIGGSINGDGLIVLEAQAIGAESTLSKMIQLVENVQMQKAPIQKLVDQISAVFVPFVLMAAVLTFLGNFYLDGQFNEALLRAVSVMVIACPCALGLATPAAIMAGTGVAAKFGILIKNAEVLELAHRIKIIAFDKTGTLTQGAPSVIQVIDLNAALLPPSSSARSLASGLQSGSEHPLAKAVIHDALLHQVPFAAFTFISNLPGVGITGQTHLEPFGQVTVGLQSLNSLSKEVFFNDLLKTLEPHLLRGQTVSILMLKHPQTGNTPLSAFVFGDDIKPEAQGVIAKLRHMGIRTVMLSGDNTFAANAVGQALGIDEVFAQVLPEDKSQWIEKLQSSPEHKPVIVAMVGDGVNDAPSLVQADVGIAMGTGTQVAMQAASVTLMRGDLNLVFAALDISKKTWNKIRQNLFWAFVFNTVGIPLAAFGLLSPMVAGSAMALSSFFVLSNALLLSKWSPEVNSLS